MLKKVWESEANSKVLAFFCHHAGRELYSREVARETGLSAGAVNQACRRLRRESFLTEAKKGHAIFYSFNYNNSLARAFKIFITIDEIRQVLRQFNRISKRIFLYGSKARGEDSEQSDYDLLVESDSPEAEEHAKKIMLKNKKYSITIKTSEEMFLLKEKDPVFYENAVVRGFEVSEGKTDENV